MNRWDSEKTFLKRVDDALYQAKKDGRDCVVVAAEELNEESAAG
jgi:PleD family two-component response regulator